MATIVFYEKPGCINNTRQKRLLQSAGHQIVTRNLLTEPWEPGELREYFNGLPVSEWLNASAPRVKSGEVSPDKFDDEELLLLMTQDPLLIRRPLMRVGNECIAGFNHQRVDAWIGLPATADVDGLEHCPRANADTDPG